MKTKHLLAIIAAAAASFAACQKPVDLGPEKVEIDSEASVEIPKEGGELTIKLTATVDWALQGYTAEVQQWLSISPESGKASADAQTITLKVLQNEGADRTANIVFYGNILCKAPLTITQKGAIESGGKGSGTLADPFNAAAANAKCAEIGSTASTEDYYVKGKIASIKEVDTGSYGNATFYISDGGTKDEEQFYVFRAYYLGGEKFSAADQIKVGDEVVVKGKLINYRGDTPELNQGGQIVSINGSSAGGDGDGDEPVAEPASATKVSIEEFLAKPVNTTDWYELSGKIISIASAAYGYFTIEDETGSVFVWGLVKAWADGKNDQSFASIGLKETDVVTMWTLRSEYNGTPQAGGSSAPAIYKSHEAGAGVTYPEGSVILTFPDDNSGSNKISNYAKTWTAKIGTNEFTIANFNNNSWNNWSYIKCGTKNGDSKASIFTATPIAAKLAKLQVSVDAIDTDYVNSVTFNVYSDAEKSTTVLSKAVEGLKTGIIEISIDADKQAAGLYYELVFDCKQAKSNGVVQISKVVYFAAE